MGSSVSKKNSKSAQIGTTTLPNEKPSKKLGSQSSPEEFNQGKSSKGVDSTLATEHMNHGESQVKQQGVQLTFKTSESAFENVTKENVPIVSSSIQLTQNIQRKSTPLINGYSAYRPVAAQPSPFESPKIAAEGEVKNDYPVTAKQSEEKQNLQNSEQNKTLESYKKIMQKQKILEIAKPEELHAVQFNLLDLIASSQDQELNELRDHKNLFVNTKKDVVKKQKNEAVSHILSKKRVLEIQESLRFDSDLISIIKQAIENEQIQSVYASKAIGASNSTSSAQRSSVGSILNSARKFSQNLLLNGKLEMSLDMSDEYENLSPIARKFSQQYSLNNFGDFGINSLPQLLVERDKDNNESSNSESSLDSHSKSPLNVRQNQKHSILPTSTTNEDGPNGNLKISTKRHNSVRFSLPLTNLEKIRESDEKEEDVLTKVGGSNTDIAARELNKRQSVPLSFNQMVTVNELAVRTEETVESQQDEQDSKIDDEENIQQQKRASSSINKGIFSANHFQRWQLNSIESEYQDLRSSDTIGDYQSEQKMNFDKLPISQYRFNQSRSSIEKGILGSKRNSIFFGQNLRMFENLSKHHESEKSPTDKDDLDLGKTSSLLDSSPYEDKQPLEQLPTSQLDNLQHSQSENMHQSQVESMMGQSSTRFHDDHQSLMPPIQLNSYQSASPTNRHNYSISNNNSYVTYFNKHPDQSVVETSNVKKQVNEEGMKKINNYTLLHELGRGGFGKVKLAESDTVTGRGTVKCQYAIKISNKQKLKRKLVSMKVNAYSMLEREVAIMKKIDHPHLVQLFEVIDDPDDEKIYMVMEYMQKGSIMSETYWKKELQETNMALYQSIFQDPAISHRRKQELLPKGLSIEKCRKYFQQFALAIDYMHNQAQVIHRDIKPENILINDEDNLKIGDFGVSHIMDSSEDSKMKENAGTRAFTAPEGWSSNFRGKPLDMWASGVTLYNMAFGELPFFSKDQMKLKDLILNQEITIPEGTDPLLADLVRKLLIKDPDQRLTAEQMLTHPWLTLNGTILLQNTAISDIQISYQDLQGAFTKKLQFATLMRVKMKLNRQLTRARSFLHSGMMDSVNQQEHNNSNNNSNNNNSSGNLAPKLE